MNITLDLGNIESIKTEIQSNFGAIVAYDITDRFSYEEAAGALQTIKTRLSELETQRKTITKPLDDAKSMVMGIFREPQECLERANLVIRSAMKAFLDAEEKKRIELQRAADEAAKKEEEQRKRDLALAAEKDLAEGRTIAAMDKVERAERVMVVAAPVPEAYRPAGTQTRKKWTFEIENIDLIPRAYLMPNEKMLQAQATSLKEKAIVPGVKFFVEKSISLKGV